MHAYYYKIKQNVDGMAHSKSIYKNLHILVELGYLLYNMLLRFLEATEQFPFKKVMMFYNTYNSCPNLQGKD